MFPPPPCIPPRRLAHGGTAQPAPALASPPPSPQEHDDKRTAEVFASLALEAVSIFAASAIFSLGGVAVSPGVPPDHASIWVNAVVQVGGGCGRALVAGSRQAGWPLAAQPASLPPSCLAQQWPPIRRPCALLPLPSPPHLPTLRPAAPPHTHPQLLTLLVFEFVGLALEGALRADSRRPG